ncbi:LysR family transcriptional regulator [Myxococcus sp. MISCRS1]|jgi:DNA-binding transcriptional LysR family regulator|uniref:LysR family transcriptional regulator n=1 Tax=Myxococcus TaxID=32 RepID=UPI001CBC4B04|nr:MULTISPECIES: LysR family transcriptional regulator [unclassified Myxococcus]MBZ4399014.1 LysR family transcriptional regulator [Myxococcus sp. AS-1-15]MBZ4413389.1 LysR family transcriptional regulator [Myxococcus sp. XM-1-1-1]MCY0999508.1 LysR family transcriptional regulator [Myxococcus sp. MISCRS1]BDT38665.1 LysR substrate-binding domain-containing protein [Myxococcus sp. MH1]
MEFRQLQLFIAVAEELHFGRAAARIGMAQPPFSQQIRRLESELGVELLTRTSRHVALTAAGARLLEEARALLARRVDATHAVREAASGESGTLRVGFAASSAFGVLPDIVLRFRTRFPKVKLELDDSETLNVGAALASGELDLAILRAPFRHEGLTVERLLRERFVLALPARHPRARQRVVALSSLAHEPFVLFPRHSAPGLHDLVTSMCLAAGFSPNIRQEARSWPSVVGMVEAGLGLTIAPASSQALCPKGVVFRPLSGAPGHAELVVAFPGRRPSPAAQHFRALAHETVSRSGRDTSD